MSGTFWQGRAIGEREAALSAASHRQAAAPLRTPDVERNVLDVKLRFHREASVSPKLCSRARSRHKIMAAALEDYWAEVERARRSYGIRSVDGFRID